MQPDFSATQTVWRGLEDDFRTLILSGFDPEICDLFTQEVFPATWAPSPSSGTPSSIPRPYENGASIGRNARDQLSADRVQNETPMNALGETNSAQIEEKEAEMTPLQISQELENVPLATNAVQHGNPEEGGSIPETSGNKPGLQQNPEALGGKAAEHHRRSAGARQAWVKIRANRAAKAEAAAREIEQLDTAAHPAPPEKPFQATLAQSPGVIEGAALEAAKGSGNEAAVEALSTKEAEHERRVAGAHKAWVKIRANRAAQAEAEAPRRGE
jgi:hypothetical protein